jgi:hypothetical protein
MKQQSAGRHVAPLGHIILISSQPVFDSLLFLLNAACSAEKQQIPILYPTGTLTITPPMFLQCGKPPLAKCKCKMILASTFSQVLAILASWHVWAKYDNLLLAS